MAASGWQWAIVSASVASHICSNQEAFENLETAVFIRTEA